jgi:sigma-B regulation protein RsbU (phosphoserine phosphatase)
MTSAADLIGTMLGTLYLTLGLAAVAATTLRSARRDRALLWFGVFTAFYGVRLIARSDVFQSVTPFTSDTWQAVEDLISYVILVPAALLAWSALGTKDRGVLRYLWVVNLVCALAAIGWDVANHRSGAAMPFNRALVVANIGLGLVSVARGAPGRRWTRDGWIVFAGIAVFAAIATYETIRGGILGPVDTEPLGMLILVLCLGYVVVKHLFHSERRMAAVGRELETARQIQQSILPRQAPTVPGLSVASHNPMAEVAGDFFDFVITPSGQLGVLVADGSGHGVPAALVASMVKMALAMQEREVDDPGGVLTRMNRALCGRFELAYVTASFALIDPAARTLTYASAGHPSPLLLRADGRLESLDERSMVLGYLPDASYSSAVVHDLSVGDRLVFYTDGITEASRPDGEFFGDQQFHRVLTTNQAEAADRFIVTLVDAARRWGGTDFADDVTVVVVDCIHDANASLYGARDAVLTQPGHAR